MQDKNLTPPKLDDTEELLAGTAVPYGARGMQGGAAMASPAPQLTGGVAASPAATPLSMDLTNNSQLLHGGGSAQLMRASSQQSPASLPNVVYGSQEFTRNITGCVPALSTLVRRY